MTFATIAHSFFDKDGNILSDKPLVEALTRLSDQIDQLQRDKDGRILVTVGPPTPSTPLPRSWRWKLRALLGFDRWPWV